MQYHEVPFYDVTISEILEVMDIGLPVEIIHFSSCGLNSSLIKLSQAKNLVDYKFLVFDFTSFNEEDGKDGRDSFSTFIHRGLKLTMEDPNISDPSESIFYRIDKIVQSLIEEKKKVIFLFLFVSENQAFKSRNFIDFINQIDKYRTHFSGKVNYLLTSTYPIFSKERRTSTPIIPKFFYFDKGEATKETIRLFAKGLGFLEIDDVILDHIYKLSAGQTVIYKNLLRDIRLQRGNIHDVLQITKIETNFFEEYPQLNHRLDMLVHDLQSEHVPLLAKAACEKFLTDEEKELLNLYIRFGVLDKNYVFKSDVMRAYFLRVYQRENKQAEISTEKLILRDEAIDVDRAKLIEICQNVSFDKCTYEIYIADVPTSEYFTEVEYKIIDLFLKNKGVVLEREEVAKVMWGDNYTIQYSDWAIDKTVSRIRTKIGDVKPYKTIVTLKKRGFLFK